jgi:type IV pilus assembly protein PilM
LQTEKFKNRKIATGVYGSSVMVKRITMPKIEKKVLAQQIRWEAEQYIPFDLNQIVLDYHTNPNSSQADSQNVLIIAAQNSIVTTAQQIAKVANLDLQILDLSSFALANAYELVAPRPKGGVILVHVGANTTHVVICWMGQVEFVREIAIGAHNCTLDIHKEMGLSIEESESLKIGASRGEEVPEDVLRYIDSFNQSISEEIKNSLDYFMASQNEGQSISQVILSGGGAKTLGLSDKIGSTVELPVHFMNLMGAFSSISPKAKMIGGDLNFFYPIAIGLSLRKKGDG